MEVRFGLLENERVACADAVAQEQDHRRQFGHHGRGLAEPDAPSRVPGPVEELGIPAPGRLLSDNLPVQRPAFQFGRDGLYRVRPFRLPMKPAAFPVKGDKPLQEVGQQPGKSRKLGAAVQPGTGGARDQRTRDHAMALHDAGSGSRQVVRVFFLGKPLKRIECLTELAGLEAGRNTPEQ